MARHITAKKQLTRERALAIIDHRMEVHQQVKEELESRGHPHTDFDAAMRELTELRKAFEWRCDTGVFPSSK